MTNLTAAQQTEALKYVLHANIIDQIRSGEVSNLVHDTTLTPDTADAVEKFYTDFWAEGQAKLAAMTPEDLIEVIRDEVREEAFDAAADCYSRKVDHRINSHTAAAEIYRRLA